MTNTMQYEEALTKIRKLLKLAASTTPEEAAVAAAQAQKLMDRYKIERLATLEEDAPAEDETLFHSAAVKPDGTMGQPLDVLGKKTVTWKAQLAYVVCRANQVEMYRGYRFKAGVGAERTIEMIGRKSDMLTVVYVYRYLIGEIERLAKAHAGNGRTWLNNFHLGAVSALRDRLYAEKQAVEEELRQEAQKKDEEAQRAGVAVETRALVRVNNALAVVESRYKRAVEYGKTKVKLKAGKRSSARHDRSAFAEGRRAGESIRLTKAKGGLPSGGGR